MRFSTLNVLALPLLAAVGPSNAREPRKSKESCSGIKWGKCSDSRIPANSTLQCGSLRVPLDYTNEESDKTLPLEIVRAPALASKSKGSIFFNAGGPGASGIEDLSILAPRLLHATGGEYDIVNVVPRGTNNTLPFACYSDAASAAYAAIPLSGSAYDTAPSDVWARAQVYAGTCAGVQAETGTLIGTAFTARDLMRVVDALEDDGLLRYWGPSYGTVLGATVIAMFPDKIDKVLLDGVVNPIQYYHNDEYEVFDNTDEALRGFASGCAESPDACPIANNQTADDIERDIVKVIDGLRTDPIAIPIPGYPLGGFIVDYSFVKAALVSGLYFPASWPSLSLQIFALQQRNVTMLAELLGGGAAGGGAAGPTPEPAPGPSPVAADGDALYGIKCSDMLVQTPNRTDFEPVFERRHAAGYLADAADMMPARCAQWLLPAKERYDGDFKVNTTNPVLVLNNQFDPVTPLVSAQNVSETLGNAVLLEQRGGYGHTALLAHISPCTVDYIQAYFKDGSVPKDGAVCEIEVGLFSGKTGWEEVLKE